MGVWSDTLKAKLETLLGERGPGTGAAVRRSEIEGLLAKAAKLSLSKAESTLNAKVAEALKVARRAESAVESLRTAQAAAAEDSADDTASNERLSEAVSLMFQWNGSSYTMRIPAETVLGQLREDQIGDEAISIAKFAADLRPVEVVTALPTTGNFEGRMAYLVAGTSDQRRLYRFTGAAWVNTNAVDQIVGKLIAGQIEAGAIGTEQLAANAVTVEKLAVGDFTNLVPNGRNEDFAAGYEAYWIAALNGGVVDYSGTVATSIRSLRLSKPAGDLTISMSVISKTFQSIEGGAAYYFETALRSGSSGFTSTAGAYVRVIWYDAAKANIGFSDVASNVAMTGVFVPFSAIVTAPSAARFARFQVYNHSTQTTVQSLLIDRILLHRANAGQLLVDGAIKGNHLAVDTAVITGSAQIGNLVVDTIHVKDGAITLWRKALPADKSSGWVAASWNTIGSLTFTPKANDMVAFVGLTINRGYTGTLALRIRWRGAVVGDFIQPFDETYGRLVEFRHFSAGGLASGTLDLQILRYEGTASLAVSDINIVVAEFMK